MDNRKPWTYRGWSIKPVVTYGRCGAFGRCCTLRQWESSFPGRARVFSRTKAGVRAYIDEVLGASA